MIILELLYFSTSDNMIFQSVVYASFTFSLDLIELSEWRWPDSSVLNCCGSTDNFNYAFKVILIPSSLKSLN